MEGSTPSGAPAQTASDSAEAPKSTETQSLEALEQELGDSSETSKEESKAEAKDATVPIKKEVKAAADKLDAEKIEGTKKYKIVVDGEEEELTEKELIARAQKSKAADRRFQESAQIKKEAIQLIEMIKNPEQLEDLLADPAIWGDQRKVVEFAQKILAKQLENEQKTPEQLRAEKAEKELQTLREQLKKEQEEKERVEYERYVQEQQAHLEEQITEAIETSGMPKSPFILKRVAQILLSAESNDKQITPKQAMNIAKKEMEKDLKEFFDVAPEEVMENLINAEKIRSLRNRQLAKIKSQQKAAPETPTKAKEVAEASPSEKKSNKVKIKDWLRS